MNQTIKIKDPLFVLRKISKDYSNDLFSDVNLTVNHDDRIAIVGPNGTRARGSESESNLEAKK